jgi:hypothetical protein
MGTSVSPQAVYCFCLVCQGVMSKGVDTVLAQMEDASFSHLLRVKNLRVVMHLNHRYIHIYCCMD